MRAVWAIPAPGGGNRAFCDRMNAWAQSEGQPGLGYIFWREGDEGGAGPDRQNHRRRAHRSDLREQLGSRPATRCSSSPAMPKAFADFAGLARTQARHTN